MKKIRFTSIKSNLYMLRIIKKYDRFRFITDFFTTLFNAFEEWFLKIYIIKVIIDGITSGLDKEKVINFVIIAIVIKCAKLIYDSIRDYYLQISNQKIVSGVQNMIFEKAAEIDLCCYDNTEYYDNYVFVNKDSATRPIEVMQSLFVEMETLLKISFSGTFILIGDPLLFAFAIIPIIGDSILRNKMKKARYDRWQKTVVEQKKVDYVKRTAYLKENAEDIRITRVKDVLMNIFQEGLNNSIQIIKDYSNRFITMYFLSESLYHVNNVLVMLYLIFRIVVTKSLSIGDFVAMSEAVHLLSSNLGKILERTIKLSENSLYIDKFRTFYEYKNTIVDGDTKNFNKDSVDQSLKLENVSFSYNNKDLVLKNISLELNGNERIAIVGKNGSGKSTLLKLIMRFYEPSAGSISYCGKNIKELNLVEYRDLFSTVFQEHNCYALSIKENVLIDKKLNEENKNKIMNIFKELGLDFLFSENDYMETVLTKEFDNNGIVLSGGQTQKLALARILIRNNNILILDEPSSALDPFSEYKLNKIMLEAAKDHMIILISHRLSTTKDADCIYYMENGEILERGSHTELMKLNGKYAEMFNVQAKQYQ